MTDLEALAACEALLGKLTSEELERVVQFLHHKSMQKGFIAQKQDCYDSMLGKQSMEMAQMQVERKRS